MGNRTLIYGLVMSNLPSFPPPNLKYVNQISLNTSIKPVDKPVDNYVENLTNQAKRVCYIGKNLIN
jgi:hypothetical protein